MGKKKGTSAFPVARIKKMMQSDEEVGKIATTTPILVGKALELMIEDILGAAAGIAQSRRAKTVQPGHLRRAVEDNDKFDFLRSTLSRAPVMEDPTPKNSGRSTSRDQSGAGDDWKPSGTRTRRAATVKRPRSPGSTSTKRPRQGSVRQPRAPPTPVVAASVDDKMVCDPKAPEVAVGHWSGSGSSKNPDMKPRLDAAPPLTPQLSGMLGSMDRRIGEDGVGRDTGDDDDENYDDDDDENYDDDDDTAMDTSGNGLGGDASNRQELEAAKHMASNGSSTVSLQGPATGETGSVSDHADNLKARASDVESPDEDTASPYTLTGARKAPNKQYQSQHGLVSPVVNALQQSSPCTGTVQKQSEAAAGDASMNVMPRPAQGANGNASIFTLTPMPLDTPEPEEPKPSTERREQHSSSDRVSVMSLLS